MWHVRRDGAVRVSCGTDCLSQTVASGEVQRDPVRKIPLHSAVNINKLMSSTLWSSSILLNSVKCANFAHAVFVLTTHVDAMIFQTYLCCGFLRLKHKNNENSDLIFKWYVDMAHVIWRFNVRNALNKTNPSIKNNKCILFYCFNIRRKEDLPTILFL